jgi:hypothetical protein
MMTTMMTTMIYLAVGSHDDHPNGSNERWNYGFLGGVVDASKTAMSMLMLPINLLVATTTIPCVMSSFAEAGNLLLSI